MTQPQAECTGNTFIDDEVLTKHLGLSQKDLGRYRNSKLVPLMPDFYVGDAADLEAYADMARKMGGVMGAFTKK